MKKQKYVANIHSCFSIAGDEYYLQPGQEIELPEHELVADMLRRNHITEAPEKKPKNNNEKQN